MVMSVELVSTVLLHAVVDVSIACQCCWMQQLMSVSPTVTEQARRTF